MLKMMLQPFCFDSLYIQSSTTQLNSQKKIKKIYWMSKIRSSCEIGAPSKLYQMSRFCNTETSQKTVTATLPWESGHALQGVSQGRRALNLCWYACCSFKSVSSQQAGRWSSLSRSPLNGHVSLAPRWRSVVSGGQSHGGQAYYPALAGEWITPQVGQVGCADVGGLRLCPGSVLWVHVVCVGQENPFDHSLWALYFHTSWVGAP